MRLPRPTVGPPGHPERQAGDLGRTEHGAARDVGHLSIMPGRPGPAGARVAVARQRRAGALGVAVPGPSTQPPVGQGHLERSLDGGRGVAVEVAEHLEGRRWPRPSPPARPGSAGRRSPGGTAAPGWASAGRGRHVAAPGSAGRMWRPAAPAGPTMPVSSRTETARWGMREMVQDGEGLEVEHAHRGQHHEVGRAAPDRVRRQLGQVGVDARPADAGRLEQLDDAFDEHRRGRSPPAGRRRRGQLAERRRPAPGAAGTGRTARGRARPGPRRRVCAAARRRARRRRAGRSGSACAAGRPRSPGSAPAARASRWIWSRSRVPSSRLRTMRPQSSKPSTTRAWARVEAELQRAVAAPHGHERRLEHGSHGLPPRGHGGRGTACQAAGGCGARRPHVDDCPQARGRTAGATPRGCRP